MIDNSTIWCFIYLFSNFTYSFFLKLPVLEIPYKLIYFSKVIDMQIGEMLCLGNARVWPASVSFVILTSIIFDVLSFWSWYSGKTIEQLLSVKKKKNSKLLGKILTKNRILESRRRKSARGSKSERKRRTTVVSGVVRKAFTKKRQMWGSPSSYGRNKIANLYVEQSLKIVCYERKFFRMEMVTRVKDLEIKGFLQLVAITAEE